MIVRVGLFSSKPQKLHLVSPFPPLFSKLSFVRTTPLLRKKIIFKGNFAFQNIFFLEFLSFFMISLYKDC